MGKTAQEKEKREGEIRRERMRVSKKKEGKESKRERKVGENRRERERLSGKFSEV